MVSAVGKPDQNIKDSRRITFIVKQGEVIDREQRKFGSASKDFPLTGTVSTQ